MAATLNTTVDRVWQLIGEPGWFINEGRLSPHTVEWDDGHVTVTDPDHGSFIFEVVSWEAPTHVALRGVDADRHGSPRVVEFWVDPASAGTTVRLVESGFATMNVPDDGKIAQHEQNTRTWRLQLDLARELLESDRSVADR